MSTASDDTRVIVLPIQPAPDAESQYRLDARVKVERYFRGETKTHRNDYLDEIVAAIDKRIGTPGIAPDEKAEFEDYVVKMRKLSGYKITTDRQVSNAYSKLGLKSDRHSNAFFAMALNMLEAENQYHEERRSSTSAIQKCIVDANNSLVGEKDADVITEMAGAMAGAVRNELTRDEKDAERSRAKHKALVDGMLSSFFKNCSHKGKGGEQRYHKPMKAFLPRVMSIGDYDAMEHTAYPHDSLGWLRLAHLYDTERIWVCMALNFDFLEQSFRLDNDEQAWEMIHTLKRRHLRKAPPYIKKCLSLDESDESNEADELNELNEPDEPMDSEPDSPCASKKRSSHAPDVSDSDDEQWLAPLKRARPADDE